MKNILIFSASIGAGHDSAAIAVKEQFLLNMTDCNIQIINTLDFINPVFHKVVQGSYLSSLKINPKVWGFIYHQTEENNDVLGINEVMSMISHHKIMELMDSFKPDVIIATHPFAAGILSSLKGDGDFDTPICTILTDFASHAFWIYDNIDTYYAASSAMVYECMDKGIPMDKLVFTGIPVRKEFNIDIDDEAKINIRKEYNLDNRPVLLVMGGGIGLGGIYQTAKTIAKTTREWQILAVAGSNRGLSIKLDKLALKYSHVRSLGYITNVHELMAVSDFLISKPGGLTSSEAMSMGLPIIIVNSLPGQEERNARFLTDLGVGIIVPDSEELVPALKVLFHVNKRKNQMVEMAKYVGNKNAAYDIYQSIYEKYLK